ncbi:hypothetical protein [Neorhizobium tomejilense]|uniref:hypothetical protein n=1 Tax=Neorhizobium tomejilense TaxID=2093828 RepID=UPI000CF9C23A|nr:hypothetical protein [Neorhizobium tomejilense]
MKSATEVGCNGKVLALLRRQGTRLAVGGLLLAASLPISFWNPISAGFFFVLGAFSCLTIFLDFQRLKSLTISLTSISTELYEKVSNAENILKEIQEIEARIAHVLTLQMLNKGGERYVGGFGEEAEFAIFKELRETKAARTDPRVIVNISELKKQLGFQLCHGIFGAKWSDDDSHGRKWALAEKFEKLPNVEEVTMLAEEDGIDLKARRAIFQAYIAFLLKDELPNDELVRNLYDHKNLRSSTRVTRWFRRYRPRNG